MQSLVTIGGYPLPEPSSYTGNTATIVDTARNVQGVMIGAVIRDDVAKVELSWRYLSVKDWAKICTLFNVKDGGSFVNSVTFFNQSTGKMSVRNMYVTDRHAGMWRRDPSTGEVLGWTECKLSLVEV